MPTDVWVQFPADTPSSSAFYVMTSPSDSDLYAQIEQALDGEQSLRHRYRRLNAVFRQLLEASLPTGGLRFGGTFAQTDYLLRQYNADASLARAIHGARTRMSAYGAAPLPLLHDHLDADVAALVRFIHLVTRAEIPASLAARLDTVATGEGSVSDTGAGAVRVIADSLRLAVTRVSPPLLYGHADGYGSGEVRVFLGANDVSPYPEWDWSYVATLAVEGTQLNLLRPRVKDGVLYPELVIVEPDYLVDVTAVATCFEEYGHSPLIHLLTQLRPNPPSQATLLGNLAGQLLDEELTLAPSLRTYAKSAQRFFRSNAVALATTALTPEFHDDACRQQQNIHHAISDGLQKHVDGFHPSQVALEPSFFSEMLGLQGRMDFLSMDFSLLVEQKSGRCGFPQRDPDTPVASTKHYVQMLLYMLLLRYNYRDVTARSGHRLLAFLLYSRYANPLLTMGFAPRLVAEAVQVRNELAAAEFRYADGGLELLATLTADDLNVRHVRSRLWRDWQRPQLEAVLDPIRQASPVERAYFLRFLAFERTEHLLAKVGDRTSMSHGFAEKWHSTLAEKLEAGSIMADMALQPLADGVAVTQLAFRLMPLPEDAASDFRLGDIVITYPYDSGSEPDARRTIVFRATIVALTTDEVTVRLRSPQSDARLFMTSRTKPWAMEHDFMESSFAATYRSLHAMLRAPEERRQLLMLQRPPRIDTTLQLRGDYGAFNDMALHVRRAQELFLIIGPPGTGKTSYGLMTTLRETLFAPSASALLVAFTNRAVDEICSKLHEDGLDFLRLGGTATAEGWLRPYLLDSRVADARNVEEVRTLLMAARIVVATTSAIAAQPALLGMHHFDVAIVDEASQILEPQLLPLWCATLEDGGTPSVGKFVLIGDHCQLAAVVQQPRQLSSVSEPLLHDILLTDCRDSLFERLLRRYRHDPDVTYMLTRQGRMHPDIADFPSRAFYGGHLIPVPLPHQQCRLPEDMPSRVEFVDVVPKVSLSDKVNDAEADVIARLAHQSWQTRPQHSIGIIVPYRNQIAAIRRHLAAFGVPELNDIAIDTVERYQGSQRDVIIYGFTVSQPHQLRFLASTTFEDEGRSVDRKLNVAMTRARERLVLVGNARLLRRNPLFASLLDSIPHSNN